MKKIDLKSIDLKRIDWKKVFKEYSIITLGLILVAIAIEYFYAPNNLAAGGLTGLGIVVNHFIPALTPSVFYFFVNIILFVVAFFIVGGDFGIKTLYGTYGLTFIMWVIENYMHPYALTEDLMLNVIFGALTTSMGLALVFNANASTGGTDILAKILNKFSTFNIGISLALIDILVTLAGAAIFGMDSGFYALLCVLLNGVLIDRFIAMFNKTKQVTVISEKNEEISKFIVEDLKRGCTFLKGAGVYSGDSKNIVYTIVKKNEISKLKEFIDKIDKNAFITIGQVEEVVGNGFPKLEGV